MARARLAGRDLGHTRRAWDTDADKLPDAVGRTARLVGRYPFVGHALGGGIGRVVERDERHSQTVEARLNGAAAQLGVEVVGHPITPVDGQKLGVEVLTE